MSDKMERLREAVEAYDGYRRQHYPSGTLVAWHTADIILAARALLADHEPVPDGWAALRELREMFVRSTLKKARDCLLDYEDVLLVAKEIDRLLAGAPKP